MVYRLNLYVEKQLSLLLFSRRLIWLESLHLNDISMYFFKFKILFTKKYWMKMFSSNKNKQTIN